MNFKDLIEHMQYDLILEGLSVIFSLYLLWQLVFHHALFTLISLFITTIC